ncbi:MAG: phosphatidylserine decarboxylase [Candidatus Saganbacteria bacterium]|nr:phosphatidylserine decarboxylase [Candidatus Saganbacteria bacterium]
MIFVLIFLALFILGGFILFFYRDPERTPPTGDLILCPADGLLMDILEEEGWHKIIIFMTLLNVHVQRVPYDGEVLSIETIKGSLLPGFFKSASKNNQVITTLNTGIGKMIVKQIVGTFVRRIDTFFKEGDKLKAGQRYGRIVFGSRVELWLPQGKVEIKVKKGQMVSAGVTVAAAPRSEN